MKLVLAVSRVSYRGVALYTVGEGRLLFFLGMDVCSAEDTDKAREQIDEWYDTKKN